jgi:tripartite-type tricarboxylate transporter receptor subunit TctC
MHHKIYHGLVIGVAGVVLCADACAQQYPSRPIRLIVPYAPGGGVDIVARALGQELTKRLGQQIVIENKTGAGGNIGSDAAAKATPDGYTLLIASPANAVNPSLYAKMPFNPVRDLVPVALIANTPAVLLVGPALPVRSIKELVALAKAKPGTLNFGSGGSGTTEHLAGEMFNAQAGIDLTHVPYKGGAAVLPDLISGQITLFFVNQTFALPYVKAGTIKALGVASDERSPALPDVPTFAEAGFADFRVSVWYGIMAPAGTPKEIISQLNREIVAALASPEMRERMQAMSLKPLPGTPAEFAAFFADEMTRWARVVKTSGAKAE